MNNTHRITTITCNLVGNTMHKPLLENKSIADFKFDMQLHNPNYLLISHCSGCVYHYFILDEMLDIVGRA